MAKSLRQQVIETIRARALLTAGDRLVLAVSGGADSVGLAHILHGMRDALGVDLSMAHLHHGLRGRAADEDMLFVEALAAELELPFHGGRADVPALARRTGLSPEMAARQARYDFLCETASQSGATAVATGHTADDQVETVLLNLARGTGLTGLTGIPYETVRGRVRIVRPLLDIAHAPIVSYLKEQALTWREDASNRSPDYIRNRVRHELLPLLEERLNPGVRDAVLRLSEVLRIEDAWMAGEAERLLEGARVKGAVGAVDCRPLRAAPLALRRRALRQWLAGGGVRPKDVDFATVERLHELARDSEGTVSVPVGGGHRAVRAYNVLTLESATEPAVSSFRVKLAKPGETVLAEQALRLVVRPSSGVRREPRSGAGRLPATGRVSQRAVGRAALYVRSTRPGDRIAPLGMTGSRKLQDLFVDEKVGLRARRGCPIVECRGEVVWVPGYTVARGWEVEGDQGPAWEIRIDRI